MLLSGLGSSSRKKGEGEKERGCVRRILLRVTRGSSPTDPSVLIPPIKPCFIHPLNLVYPKGVYPEGVYPETVYPSGV